MYIINNNVHEYLIQTHLCFFYIEVVGVLRTYPGVESEEQSDYDIKVSISPFFSDFIRLTF